MGCTDWVAVTTAVATLLLAVIAIFQEPVRRWFYRPKFQVTAKSEPPFCMSVPEKISLFVNFQSPPTLADVPAVYLRVRVTNVGNATALNTEVYAQEIERKRVDGTWESVPNFPPMNLVWSDFTQMYLPKIVPGMSKYCDIASTYKPDEIAKTRPQKEGLDPAKTSLTFRLIVHPNHMGHILGPGEYRLRVLIGAENSLPTEHRVYIRLSGAWYDQEATMLRDGVGISVE